MSVEVQSGAGDTVDTIPQYPQVMGFIKNYMASDPF